MLEMLILENRIPGKKLYLLPCMTYNSTRMDNKNRTILDETDSKLN